MNWGTTIRQFDHCQPMQLDRTSIVVRERSYPEILHLAMFVLRTRLWQVALTSLAGVAPFAVLNAWLLADYRADLALEGRPDTIWSFVWRLLYLMVAELPLASVPTTVYLGYALFLEQPQPGRIVRDVLHSAGQLLLLVVLPRMTFAVLAAISSDEIAILFTTMLLLAVLVASHVFLPYVTEIILLERNPLVRKGRGGMSTLARIWHLHIRAVGDTLGRLLLSMLFGGAWVVALWLALCFLAINVLTGGGFGDISLWTIHLPIAWWTVASVFAVVRYLSYLDQRIRDEGWEVELLLKAEAGRMARRLT